MKQPTLYIIAGPHGIGKTTATYDLIPKLTPVINADEITKVVTLTGSAPVVNILEYSNRKAARLIQEKTDERVSFCIETNLSDEESWKFLINIRNSGYRLELIFLCTDNVFLLNKRIEERAQRGEPDIEPWEVEERYFKSLQLLDQYFDIPVMVQLIDNSEIATLIVEKTADLINIAAEPLPDWVQKYLIKHLSVQEDGQLQTKKLPSKNDARQFFKNASRLK
jgi:predicted ABC-type ATPase